MSIFKKDKVALDMQTISTLVSEGCIIDGNVKAPAFARVDGEITGDVSVDEGLILGEKGSIRGNVTTREMIVYGIIDGNLQVRSLQIKSSGKVTGNISTQVLEVETGAVYDGILSMTQNSKKEQSQISKPKARRPVEIESKVES